MKLLFKNLIGWYETYFKCHIIWYIQMIVHIFLDAKSTFYFGENMH